jgi:molecular chaperone DnaK (HSP70)
VSGRIVGIDLGTTNSEVAAWTEAGVVVLEEAGSGILPSVVAIDPDGRLLVGEPAQNQLLLYPERAVRAVKRLMGTAERVTLGDRTLRPQEVSALILSTLRERAERVLGEPVAGAVITVPAWFTDAQRQATREAGEIAGLVVHRIVNEPTAASLAYTGAEEKEGRTFLVYDLGGGTFDVSVVRIEAGIHEVLASHGDTRLGGEDLDEILFEKLLADLEAEVADAVRKSPRARIRLLRAAEGARRRLSEAPYATVREEAVVTVGDLPRHVEVEVSREEFETLARPLVDRTLESVRAALEAAKLGPKEIDGVLLAGGVTRMPLVRRLLRAATGQEPRADLHPDLCVALGAGLLAARLAGQEESRILVDITPYSFGISHAEWEGDHYAYDRYRAAIRRGTALPAATERTYYPLVDGQERVDFRVYQGESRNADENLLIGRFVIEGLADVPADDNEILVRFDLDVSGMLHVRATERGTGLSKAVRIEGALGRMGERELARARERFAEITGRQIEAPAPAVAGGEPDFSAEGVPAAAKEAVSKYAAIRDRLHDEDRAEGDALVEAMRGAGRGKGTKNLTGDLVKELEELLFYAGGEGA